MKQYRLTLLVTIIALCTVPTIVSAEPSTRTLAFELECLDLDGDVVSDECRIEFSEGAAWDILIGHHAYREVHAVLVQNHGNRLEIAVLDDAVFEDVTEESIAGASFATDLQDHEFTDRMVVLVRTDSGAVFKVGNVVEGENDVRIDYELLQAGE